MKYFSILRAKRFANYRKVPLTKPSHGLQLKTTIVHEAFFKDFRNNGCAYGGFPTKCKYTKLAPNLGPLPVCTNFTEIR